MRVIFETFSIAHFWWYYILFPRLYPPVPLSLRRTIADDEIGGYFIPKGTTVAIIPPHRYDIAIVKSCDIIIYNIRVISCKIN